ncbi:MAG: TonB-dependent receptor [Muribaculaceae bacterium]|nr:TonB-dependent receptor [Muribaculaceae bacterium]
MTKKFFIFLLAFLSCLTMSAQEIKVTGTVTDSEGEPLIGVSIVDKSTPGKGAITDIDGNYSISMPTNGKLTFGMVGYVTETISIDGRSEINVVMKEDTNILDELVVVGYGTQNRSKMSSSVATVSAKDAIKQQSSNVASSLQGRAAGVDVVQQGGIAGADVNIVVRGAASLTATDPLYIIDGVFANSGLSTLNPSDIETIQVLKDGAAAAIYGSRAANGVVIITTKNGQKGSVKVNANFGFSVQTLAHTPKFLNASQWREFANMVSDNSGLARAPENVNPTDPSIDTDWVDVWTRNAPIYTADAQISGGNDYGTYSFSLGYLNQEGVTLKSEYEKYSARTNSNWQFGRFFVSENAQIVWRHRTPTSTFNIGMPTLPVTDQYGRYASWGSQYYIEAEDARRNNPFGGLYATDTYTNYFDVMGGFSAGVEIIKGLKFTTSFSGNYTASHGYTHTPIYYTMWDENGTPDSDYGNPKNSLSESRGQTSNYTWDNVFNFDRDFGKHSLSVTLGQSWMREFYRGMSYETIDDLGASNIVGVTNVDAKVSSNEKNAALLSFFGRANYDFDGRYLLSASLRRDESSKFHKNHRVGYFPAVSAGWNMHNEKWLQGTTVSLLKITASYGELGANFLNPYNFDNIAFGPIVYTVGGIRYVDGRAAYLKTTNLKWETSKTADVGLELGLFNNEVTFHVNYFYKKNVDLLATIDLNLSSGQIFEVNTSNETPYVNTASVQNKGWEFMVNWHRNFTRDFRINATANLSTLSNKVLALGDNVQPITSGTFSSKFSDAATITRPGDPIGSFYGYKIDGFDADGNFIFHDENGDGIVTADDKVILGSSIPKISYGLNLDFIYKDFDLSLFFNGVGGNKIFNAQKYQYYFNYANNMVVDVLNSWTPDNKNTYVPVAKVTNADGGNSLPSEFYVEDGSYFRLKNVQLGYTLPERLSKKAYMSNLRFYFSVQNVFTCTKYSGFDPEVSSNTLFARGVDQNSYPNARTYTIGFNLTF